MTEQSSLSSTTTAPASPVSLIESSSHDSTVRHKAYTRRRTTTRRDPELDEQYHPSNVSYVSFLCGISAGILQAGLFNPWDRALYLSVKNEVPFLTASNFRNPYLGFFQSVGHRALSGGLYYPLENVFCSLLLPYESDQQQQQYHTTLFFSLPPALSNFIAGTLAGTCNALIVNPVTAIKYKSWGREVNRGMFREAVEMFHQGGLRPFVNGLLPTVWRDLVFGGTYTFLRLELQYRLQLRNEHQWTANMVAAALATIVSGPFNLARNVQYATRSKHAADTMSKVWQDLVQETQARPSLVGKAMYVQNRLRIGWGTVRVAVGMSFGHFVYDKLMERYYHDQQRLQ
jgi:hypothetical protein